MAWSGAPVSAPSSLEIRRLLQSLALDSGHVVRCVCGASRYCAGLSALEDEQKFSILHKCHKEGGPWFRR